MSAEARVRVQSASPPPSVTPVAKGLLQRKCACGGSPGAGGECAECQKKRLDLQRKEAGSGGPATVPPIVHEVLSSPGRPLDREVRSFIEPLLGHDFSRVRIHTGSRAAESAREVNALAYAVGGHVVFGAGQFMPETKEGKRLLAHELTHVVQQASKDSLVTQVGDPADPTELQAESAADRVASGQKAELIAFPGAVKPVLQRKIVVTTTGMPVPRGFSGPPTPFTVFVQNLMRTICPSGNFQVDPETGEVGSPDLDRFCQWRPPLVAGQAEADISTTPASCRCLCDVVNHDRTVTIAYKPGLPEPPGTMPGSSSGEGGVQTDPIVFGDLRFKFQILVNGKWVDQPSFLVLAHEVCGHALPFMRGTHVARGPLPPGGTPPEEVEAVNIERRIAAEHGAPKRSYDYLKEIRQKP